MQDNEYSRPATFADLKKIVQSLNTNNAPYILIGGYALFSHGYHRATEDIDLLIPVGSHSAEALIKALLVLADKASADLDPTWFDEGDNIRLADEVVVDLLFKTCGETYESLQPYIETIDLEGIQVQTLTLEGLLKTKQSDREKDIIDRMVLERAIEARKKL